MTTQEVTAIDWTVGGEERLYRSLRRYWHPVLYASELQLCVEHRVPVAAQRAVEAFLAADGPVDRGHFLGGHGCPLLVRLSRSRAAFARAPAEMRMRAALNAGPRVASIATR